jgi:hypothetical protein
MRQCSYADDRRRKQPVKLPARDAKLFAHGVIPDVRQIRRLSKGF